MPALLSTRHLLSVAAALLVPAAVLAAEEARLASVAEGLDYPVNAAVAPGQAGRFYVVEHFTGRIRIVEDGEVVAEPFLDLEARLDEELELEEGLLALAFPPTYPDDRRVYVSYTGKDDELRLSRFDVAEGGMTADAASEEILIATERWAPYHHCGHLAFGPKDGMLYYCIGDSDENLNPLGTAQDLGRLQGSLLRLDVGGDDGYAVPEDNPFVGEDGARPEIWLYGVRNPWTFGFDPATGDLVVPDVAHAHWHELNVLPAGAQAGSNLGWALAQGNACMADCAGGDLTWPLYVYPQGRVGCAIIGGTVYRGARFPKWQGAYVFADWCSTAIWAMRDHADGGGEIRRLSVEAANPTAIRPDAEGELLVVDGPGGALRRLVFPDDVETGWRPLEEVLSEHLVWAQRQSFGPVPAELERMVTSRRWQWSSWVVETLKSLARPFE